MNHIIIAFRHRLIQQGTLLGEINACLWVVLVALLSPPARCIPRGSTWTLFSFDGESHGGCLKIRPANGTKLYLLEYFTQRTASRLPASPVIRGCRSRGLHTETRDISNEPASATTGCWQGPAVWPNTRQIGEPKRVGSVTASGGNGLKVEYSVRTELLPAKSEYFGRAKSNLK